MNWEKDGHGNFDTKVGGQALIDHLDEIRYGLKKVLKIELGERATYNLMLSRDVGNADQFRIEKGYKVEVEQCTGCSNQFNGRFKTFHHKISKINGKFDYNSIGGLKFILPGMNKKPIKILLDDPKGSKTIGNLSYNLCMGDVYVYFSNDSDPSAQVPLFFYFNDKWYMPGTIQDYFAKWSYIEQSEVLNKMNRLVDDRIKDYVNKVNRMTNNLDEFQDFSVEFTRPVSSEVNEMPSVNSIKMPPVDDLEIFTVRKEKPSENFANSYVDIETTPFYNLKISSDNDIRKPCLDFEMPYIDPKIPSDNNMKIPSDDDKETPCVDLEMPSDIYVEKPYVDFQMPFIGLKKPHLADLEKFSVDGFEKPSIIHEDQPKEVPIYDILDFSQSHGPDVELGKGLRNFSDTGKHSEEELTGFPEPVIMAYTGLASASDESNQSHLGSILGGTFDKKNDYSCCNTKDTYCKNKLVEVKESKIGEHQKLITANYITYGHCAIDVEVEKSERKKSNTKETSDVRKSRLDITAKNLKIDRTIVRLTHTTDPEKDPLFKENDVYVHFYGNDPRPLLVYCNDSAFAPKGVKEYKNNWILVEDVDYSNRGDGNYRLESVLDKLHEISYKLNPVDISQLNCYGIETHFWEKIKIHVRYQKFGIYKLYIHTASEGHKLGELTYKDQYIVDPSYPNKYHEIKEVIVYYYIFDEENKYPLLIQLLFENHSHNLYYLLSSLDHLAWTKKYKIYLKLHRKENYEEAIFKILSQFLDKPEFTSLKNDIFSKFDTTEQIELQKHRATYSSSGETTVEPKASKLVDGVNSPTSDSVKTVSRDKKCRGVTRGDSIARCDSISTRDSSDNTYLYKYLASIEEGETATTKPERRTVRSAEAYLPNNPGTEIKVLKAVTTDVDSENKLLMYIIGASVGSLFGVAALIFLLYKLFKRYLRDMRPLV
ncbi:hypothetical protein MACJ_001506 [Theileria orientalis]|uniref:Uncharacterized protein n=1 Tax=Theileria orientalis TaxID=68886 RepID=A0A976QTH1_THEOR|nr:hypothetical protein MACJ_001506 [Theileria orientalis]